MNKSFRSGFVSIVGRPNAGKSTLLNALIGQKVAIVADKPQTTRTSIQGVLTLPEAQIVFLDTPGIHKADTPLNKRLMNAVRASLDERDLLLFVADAARPFEEEDRRAPGSTTVSPVAMAIVSPPSSMVAPPSSSVQICSVSKACGGPAAPALMSTRQTA